MRRSFRYAWKKSKTETIYAYYNAADSPYDVACQYKVQENYEEAAKFN